MGVVKIQKGLVMSVLHKKDMMNLKSNRSFKFGSRGDVGIIKYLFVLLLMPLMMLEAQVPGYATAVFVNGDPLGGGTSGEYSTIRYIPTPNSQNSDTSVIKHLAKNKETGTVWGLAYDKKNQIIYASAVLKRHCGLGPLGLGGIYKIDVSDLDNPVVSNFTTVPNVGSVKSNADRDLPKDALNGSDQYPSRDPIFDEIGKVGLGDIDLSPDGKTLYAVNINEKKLVAIDVSNPNSKTTYSIPDPFGGCSSYRPWAVKVRDNGDVYVGSTCPDDTDKGVAVAKFDTSAHTFSTVVTKKVTDNNRDPVGLRDNDDNPNGEYPKPWTSNPRDVFRDSDSDRYYAYPQLVLSDIEFDKDGSIILGMLDRSGLQGGCTNSRRR